MTEGGATLFESCLFWLLLQDMSYLKNVVRTWICKHFNVQTIVRTQGNPHGKPHEEFALSVHLTGYQDNQKFKDDFKAKLQKLIDQTLFKIYPLTRKMNEMSYDVILIQSILQTIY